MALIKCPECGHEISSKAKTCVHCGCNIFVCPECNKAYSEAIERCNACGYIMNEKAHTSPEYLCLADNSATLKNNNELNEFLIQQKKKVKIKNLVNFVVCVIMLLVASIALIVLYRWFNKEELEMLNQIFSVRKTIRIILILVLIIAIAGEILFMVYNYFLQKQYFVKLKGMREKCRELLLQYKTKEDSSKMVTQNCAEAILWIEQDEAQKKWLLLQGIMILIQLLLVIVGGIFLLKFIDSLLALSIAGQSFSFDIIKNEVTLYITIGLAIIKIVYPLLTDFYASKEIKRLQEKYKQKRK